MGDADTTAVSAEARWRNYQHLIWTQQQIQLQIQQQNQQNQQQLHHHHQQQQQSPIQNVKMELEQQAAAMNNLNGGGGGHQQQQQQQQPQQQQSLPLPPEKSPSDEKAAKGDAMDPWDNFDAQAAFLGPTLWDKRLPYDGQDFKLEYVDLEEFLTENGIPVERQNGHGGQAPSGNSGGGSSASSSSGGASNGLTSNGDQIANSGDDLTSQARGAVAAHLQQQQQQAQQPQQPQPTAHLVGQYGPGPSVRNNQGHNNHNGHIINHTSLNNPQNLMRGPPSLPTHSENSRSPSPCGSSISRSSDESTSTIHSHHQGLSLRKYLSNGVTFSISDLGLGSIPGHDFDPRTRIFTEDELKPQPMIKKSKKQFVPDDQKDAKYWARRRKNNMAAKRSRDARRVKENQIAMRACFLEKENSILKSEVDRVQKENMMLKEQLTCCRHDH